MKSFESYLIIVLFSISGTAQQDTIYFDNLMGYDTNIFVSSDFSFNPEIGTIYNRIDSSEYNGTLQINYYDKSGGQENLKMLSEVKIYSVNNGLCNPVFSVRYFPKPQDPERKIIQAQSFFSDTSSVHIAYNKNGNPWCIERSYLDSLGVGRSEKTILDSLGRLMTKIQRKDGYIHGLIQTVISSGDTLILQYETAHLIEVLNKNILFFSEDDRLISESEFIDRSGGSNWVYYWSYIVIPGNENSTIIFYRYNGNDGELRVFSEGYCLSEKRRKKLIRKSK